MNWFRKLFNGCVHKWVLFREIRIVDDDNETIGTKYVLQCEKCGDLKNRRS